MQPSRYMTGHRLLTEMKSIRAGVIAGAGGADDCSDHPGGRPTFKRCASLARGEELSRAYSRRSCATDFRTPERPHSAAGD